MALYYLPSQAALAGRRETPSCDAVDIVGKGDSNGNENPVAGKGDD